MQKNDVINLYYDWLSRIVCDDEQSGDYSKLLARLHLTEFTWTVANDCNRAADGIDLRAFFSDETSVPMRWVNLYLPDYCSILEMMVALARRLELSIMGNPDEDERIGRWFWTMIGNLGLEGMYNAAYDQNFVDDTINRFLNRKYTKNGDGGLFYVKRVGRKDLRKVEIWYQALWYLDETIKE
jgi:hypothetical protein